MSSLGRIKQFCPYGHDTLLVGRTNRFCKQCKALKEKEFRASHPVETITRRKYNLKHFYGMTLEDYNQMLQGQKGLCLGCYRHISILRRGLCVDHDHVTGKVRGLLCHDCNLTLRRHITSAILRRLADYLERGL